MGARHGATIQTIDGRPVLAAEGLNLRAAEAAIVRNATLHADTLAAAARMLGLTAGQLRRKARQLRVALPFAAPEGRRPSRPTVLSSS